MQELNSFDIKGIKLPIRIGFFLQKNIQTIITAAKEIEQARLDIAMEYGQPNKEDNGYTIPQDKLDIVNQELTDLFNLEQDIPIHIFKLDEFEGMELEYEKLSAILFMIEE